MRASRRKVNISHAWFLNYGLSGTGGRRYLLWRVPLPDLLLRLQVSHDAEEAHAAAPRDASEVESGGGLPREGVDIICHARIKYVGKYQSCMVLNSTRIVSHEQLTCTGHIPGSQTSTQRRRCPETVLSLCLSLAPSGAATIASEQPQHQ